jgi:hypothetical protein
MGFTIKTNYGPNIEVNEGGVVNLNQRKDGLWKIDAAEAKVEEAAAPPVRTGRPRKAGKKILKSFIYKAHTDEETNLRLQALYNALLQLGWIAGDTRKMTFLNIFSGEETTCRVVWTGEISTLAELFRELVSRKRFVTLPDGESIWIMVNARFWEKEGNREFGNNRLRSTAIPAGNKETLDLLVKVMDPDLPLDTLRELMQARR